MTWCYEDILEWCISLVDDSGDVADKRAPKFFKLLCFSFFFSFFSVLLMHQNYIDSQWKIPMKMSQLHWSIERIKAFHFTSITDIGMYFDELFILIQSVIYMIEQKKIPYCTKSLHFIARYRQVCLSNINCVHLAVNTLSIASNCPCQN